MQKKHKCIYKQFKDEDGRLYIACAECGNVLDAGTLFDKGKGA